MKVLIFVADSKIYFSQFPFFKTFSQWLLSNNYECMVSLPKTFSYVQFDKDVKIHYRKSKSEDDPSLLNNLRINFINEIIHPLFPVHVWSEILWKPDILVVMSNPFIDHEVFLNTWLMNVLMARKTPVVKLTEVQPLFDQNQNENLIEKHRSSLELFKEFYFLRNKDHRSAQRSVSFDIKKNILQIERCQLNYEQTNLASIKMLYCPLPLRCSLYLQDLLVKGWYDKFKDRKDVVLGLNPFGPDKEFIQEVLSHYNINYKWINVLELHRETISGLFIGSVYELTPEYWGFEEIKSIVVLRIHSARIKPHDLQLDLNKWFNSDKFIKNLEFKLPDLSETCNSLLLH